MEIQRYSRQILFSKIKEKGQNHLLKSRVAIVGMGALGTVIANHLVRSGIGFIRIIDRDFVEASNLQRQTLYDEEDAQRSLPKAIAAFEKLRKINSEITIEPVVTDIHPSSVAKYLSDVDIIIDGTDNFQTRYLINDVSLKYGIPWVYGGAVGSRGMYASFRPGKSLCYRCLFPQIPVGRGETCDTTGVISPITDIVGSFQSLEAMKILLGHDQDISKGLVQFDIWKNSFFDMDISSGKNETCTACVAHNYHFLDESDDGIQEYSSLCGRNTVQISPRKDKNIDLVEIEKNLEKIGRVEKNPFLLRCFVDQYILVLFKNGRVLVQGTEDLEKAKVLYHRYIG